MRASADQRIAEESLSKSQAAVKAVHAALEAARTEAVAAAVTSAAAAATEVGRRAEVETALEKVISYVAIITST